MLLLEFDDRLLERAESPQTDSPFLSLALTAQPNHHSCTVDDLANFQQIIMLKLRFLFSQKASSDS